MNAATTVPPDRPARRWPALLAEAPVIRSRFPSAVAVLALVGVFTGLIALLRLALPRVHFTILYLVPVLALASLWGRGPAIVAAVLGVLAYNFFFIEPVFTLWIHNPDEWVTLLVFLLTAVVAGQLAASLRVQAEEARARETTSVLLLGQLALAQEARTRAIRERADLTAALYELTQALIAERELPQLLALIAERVVATFGVRGCAILLPDGAGRLQVRAHHPPDEVIPLAGRNEEALEQWTFGQPDGGGATSYGMGLFVPLQAGTHRVGLMRVTRAPGTVFDDERRRLLSTFAAGAALAIERATLAEAALRAAVLSRSDELKSALLSSVSHDLRTPLAAIKGSVSSLLVEGTGVTWDDATRREFLLTIDEETDRLTRLVGNLLDLSRIEAGALHPHREPYPLDELLWQAIDRLAVPGLAERVRVTLPDDLPLVPLDPVLLERVFTHLLDNAAKYSPPGSPIAVVAERHGPEVRVSVIDRGPGVPADERARIFDRFYRAGQSRVVKGTGLGLAISRGFVEAHGGRLWVEDAPGGGAAFVVALPLERAMSDEQ